jgi:hypothetical protein
VIVPEPAPHPAHVIVILGCAVRALGAPSQAMQRRVDQALQTGRHLERVSFVPIGGVGRHPPAEALVMQGLLRAGGVSASSIEPVPLGKNTIVSLRACWPVLCAARAWPEPAQIHICTDAYHMLRCRAILWLWGLETRALCCPTPRTRGPLSYMLVRDRLALIKDVCLALFWRLTRQVPAPDARL